MKIIRKLDSYNFTLSTFLDTPSIVKIGDKEIEYKFKNHNVYYGTLHGAIRGCCRHNNKPYFDIPESLKKVKPYSDEKEYIKFMEINLPELQKLCKSIKD